MCYSKLGYLFELLLNVVAVAINTSGKDIKKLLKLSGAANDIGKFTVQAFSYH